MDAKRSEQQRVGDNIPEGAQFTEQGPVSGGVSDILRDATDMLDGVARASHLAEIRQKGEAESGDGMRRLR